MPVPGLEHKRLTASDGTEIAYQVRGEGPAIVLSNGLGGTYEAFRHIYSGLGEGYRIVCWDYRGLYRSARPRDLRRLRVPHHASDLLTILETEKIDRAVFVGWSMGVQVNFEMLREQRARVAGIVAVNGTYGTPFRTAMASRLARYFIPLGLSLMKAQAPLVSKAAKGALAWNGLIPAMTKAGLVSTTIDAEAMFDVAADFHTMDFAIYSDILRYLGEHDARDLLPSLDVPLLVVTGDRDLFTPVFTARKMNQLVRGSRLVVIPGGTHYTPIEYPALIQDEIHRFLEGIPGWSPARPEISTAAPA